MIKQDPNPLHRGTAAYNFLIEVFGEFGEDVHCIQEFVRIHIWDRVLDVT